MITENIKLYNQDCLEGIKNIPDGSIDVILTDPPYLYLKNQKLEREFDEMALFTEWKRVLKKGGFIVLFGRGTSFYRWNTRLDDLGFEFKEEIIWNKKNSSSPLLPLHRVHETISIHTIGAGQINKVKVPYLEMKENDIPSIIQDIKRIRTILKNTKSLNNVLNFLQGKSRFADKMPNDGKHNINGAKFGEDRCVTVVNSMIEGMNEKSIIEQVRNHYKSIHPTEKPVRLLERLLALVSKEGDTILDCFSGSGSTAEACINTQRKFIGFEIDEEYYNDSVERIEVLTVQTMLELV